MQGQVHVGQGQPVILEMIRLRSGLSLCFFKERHFGPDVMVIAPYTVDISASACCPLLIDICGPYLEPEGQGQEARSPLRR